MLPREAAATTLPQTVQKLGRVCELQFLLVKPAGYGFDIFLRLNPIFYFPYRTADTGIFKQ